MIGRRRLAAEHVERGATQTAFLQSYGERLLIDDASP
jgi:hypothetical protein